MSGKPRTSPTRAATGLPPATAMKAEFFKALAHPLRIWILELLRAGPLSVTQIQGATGAPASSVSQQLAVLRSRNILATERRGTTIIYRVPDPELFELLDVARSLFNIHLRQTIRPVAPD